MQELMTLLFYIIITSALCGVAVVIADYTTLTDKLLKLFMED